jgi:signal transduction histidine kinase
MSADVAADVRFVFHPTRALDVGPAMMIPLTGTAGVRGVLSVVRVRGRRWFDEADLDMATAFAAHAAVALGLAAARRDQERVRLLEDRNRIAHDLHDHVIQRLFAAGMKLQGVPGLGDEERLARVDGVIDDIDDVIGQIRSTIFGLRGALGPQMT